VYLGPKGGDFKQAGRLRSSPERLLALVPTAAGLHPALCGVGAALLLPTTAHALYDHAALSSPPAGLPPS
jgi:hypothetical protein